MNNRSKCRRRRKVIKQTMRTRRSPRNQEILFKSLFKPPLKKVIFEITPCCWDCKSYPKNGRNTGFCSLRKEKVYGRTKEEGCFERR